jgi:hypothetical protein
MRKKFKSIRRPQKETLHWFRAVERKMMPAILA